MALRKFKYVPKKFTVLTKIMCHIRNYYKFSSLHIFCLTKTLK